MPQGAQKLQAYGVVDSCSCWQLLTNACACHTLTHNTHIACWTPCSEQLRAPVALQWLFGLLATP